MPIERGYNYFIFFMRGRYMNTYTAVKNRILFLCEQKRITINKLASESGIAPSTIKNILYVKLL